MKLGRMIVVLALLIGLLGGSLAGAVQHKPKPPQKHSAAWYKTHKKTPPKHSAAWYKTHKKAPPKHTAAWYKTHKKGAPKAHK